MLTGGIEPTLTARCLIYVSVSEDFEKSDAVFAGKVIAEEYRPLKTPTEAVLSDLVVIPQGPAEVLTVRFAVEKWWKGGKSEEVTLHTSFIRYSEALSSSMAEDFRFSLGERYLVYAFKVSDNLRTSVCKRTKKLELVGEDLQKLGEGKAPEK